MIPITGETVEVETGDKIKRGECLIPQPKTRDEDYEAVSLIKIDEEKMWYSHDTISKVENNDR